jgi:SAM-dependent methyltransferase
MNEARRLDLESTAAEVFDPLALLGYVPASAMRLLDCGASGALPRRLVQRDGAFVTTVEIIGAQDRAARSIPEAAGAFDCIIAVDVLPRVRDAAPLMQELNRVLAPGGTLLLTFPNAQFYRIVLRLAEGLWTRTNDGVIAHDHIRFYTAYEGTALVREAGFDTLEIHPIAGVKPEDVPLDDAGCIVHGDLRIGPLTSHQYLPFLTSQFLVIARKAGPAHT